MPADTTLTTDFVYLRFHGLKDGAYHDYTNAELEPWARALARAARKGLPGYVYFNNDLNTRAPLNAHALMRLVDTYAVTAKADNRGEGIAEIAAPQRGPETWPDWKRGAGKTRRATQRTRRRTAAAAAHRPSARVRSRPHNRSRHSARVRSGRRSPPATTGRRSH